MIAKAETYEAAKAETAIIAEENKTGAKLLEIKNPTDMNIKDGSVVGMWGAEWKGEYSYKFHSFM